MVFALLIVGGLGTGYLIGMSNQRTAPSFSTTTKTSVTTTTYYSSTTRIVLINEAFLMSVNGSYYWADDVSKDTVIGLPGYSYFLNGSITFDGVKFQTICPPSYQICPGSNSNSTTVLAGAIRFNMTFPDGTVETTGDVIGASMILYILSQHTPRAGMFIEYVNDYGPGNSVDYAVFLLVSSCGKSPYLC